MISLGTINRFEESLDEIRRQAEYRAERMRYEAVLTEQILRLDTEKQELQKEMEQVAHQSASTTTTADQDLRIKVTTRVQTSFFFCFFLSFETS